MRLSLGHLANARGPEARRETPKAAEPARTPSHGSRGAIFSALRFRNYRLFWTGQIISVSGTFMQGTAQQWLVLQLTRDPLALGIVGALQFGPLLVLAPFGGIIADRWSRRRVLIGTQSVAGLLAFILWTLTATGLVQLWHVCILALLLGLVNAVDMPTRQSFVSEMVPAESLLNAVSLNSAQFNVARILGPGLAGLMIALLGVPVLFLLNALSFLAVIAGLLMMRVEELIPVRRGAALHGFAQVRALGEGVRFIAASPSLRITLLMVAVIGTFGFNFNVLLPLEARGVLHAGPQVFGLVSSALGVGALAGALLLAGRRGAPTNRMLVATAICFGVLEAAVVLTDGRILHGVTDVVVAMVLIGATGIFMSSFSASANTRTQLSSPPEMRGRVMSIYMMLFAGTTPIGNLLVSAVAGSPGGVPLAWVVSGLPCLAVAIVAAVLWRRLPAAAPATTAPSTSALADATLGTPSGTLAGRMGDAAGALLRGRLGGGDISSSRLPAPPARAWDGVPRKGTVAMQDAVSPEVAEVAD